MPSNSSAPVNSAKNATAIAAAAAAAAAKKSQLAKMAIQQHYNEQAVKNFAAAMAGVIFMFTIFHWCRFLYSRYASKQVKKSNITKGQVSVTRIFRHFLNRRLPGFTSVGHGLLVFIYLAINVSVTVTKIDWTSLLGISKRLGWMTVANIVFITFLALKNTPLAYLTFYSYESLNPLHQIGGYTTVAFGLLHAITQCVSWYKKHRLPMLLEKDQISGMVAASALLIILTTAIIVRRIRYEFFYVVHIVMYMLILINLALHRPDLTTKSTIGIIVAAAMWGSDRLFRGCRVLWNSYHNGATITPLPNGGTRIVLRHSPSRSIPGTHCFLWVPKIRLIETHPFTIVSATPSSLELVVAAYDGFTNDLHDYAVKNPGVTLRASIDGPYGALPNFSKVADKIILVAGGSGASFTFGVALDIVKKLDDTNKLTMDFIWTVREQETLSWFSKELTELQAYPRVSIFLHTTRPSPSASLQSPSSPTSPLDVEKKHIFPISQISSSSTSNTPSNDDIEKENGSIAKPAIQPWESTSSLELVPGRPDIAGMIKDVVMRADSGERISIAACGPDSLMWTVRKTAAECISISGPSIELHCEQFGW